MKLISDLSLEVVVGGCLADVDIRPLRPYSSESIELLSALSRKLLKSAVIRTYPEIAAFAFWCRRANLIKLSQGFNVTPSRIGRGLVLHISPANVPVNFAFSLAFGLLAGNANIVRIPSIKYPQVDIICREISNLLTNPIHSRMAGMIRIVQYPRNDEISAEFSKTCHARVLWGGDSTVLHLRSMPTSPRCVDVCFANRYSLCVLGANAVLAAEEKQFQALVAGFYNDSYLFDQEACSSPRLVLWQGEEEQVAHAMRRFWQGIERFLQIKPVPPLIHAVEKFHQACRSAILIKESKTLIRHQNLIYRIYLENVPKNISLYSGRYGFFFETRDDNMANLKAIVQEHYQTITFFGIDSNKIIDLVYEWGLIGIDRVVPVGKALDMGVIWDGYDIISMLSRVISTR